MQLTSLNDMRIAFNLNLARLYNSATQQKGMIECKKLMAEYSSEGQVRQMVRIVLGALTDKSLVTSASNSANYMSLGLHASLFGELAQICKKDMIDPIDKVPNRRKTFESILRFMIGTFFSEGSDVVANGCFISIAEIMEEVFPEQLFVES